MILKAVDDLAGVVLIVVSRCCYDGESQCGYAVISRSIELMWKFSEPECLELRGCAMM